MFNHTCSLVMCPFYMLFGNNLSELVFFTYCFLVFAICVGIFNCVDAIVLMSVIYVSSLVCDLLSLSYSFVL